MSLMVDPGLARMFTLLTGTEWPDADEDALLAVAVDYQKIAEDLIALKGYVADLAKAVRQRFDGDAAIAYAQTMERLLGGSEDTFGTAAKQAHQLSDFARKTSNQVEYAKWMAIAQLIQLAGEIAVAIALAPVTFGQSLLNLSWEYALTREALIALLTYLLRGIVWHTVLGVAGGMIMDAVIQDIQMDMGHEKEWNHDASLQALEFGAITGALGGAVGVLAEGAGKALGNLVGKSAGKLAGDELKEPLLAAAKDAANAAGHDAAAAATHDITGVIAHDASSAAAHDAAAATARDTADAAAHDAASTTAHDAAAQGLQDGVSTVGRGATDAAGSWPGEKASIAFGRDVGDLLGATAPQLGQGFAKTGAGTVAGRFAESMGGIFKNHLGEVLGDDAARDLGEKYGAMFVKHWGTADADHAALNDSLKDVLADSGLHSSGIKALAEGLPAAAEHMHGEGNFGFRLGSMVGSSAVGAVQNNLTEGFYNLIFSEDHTFHTGYQTFLSGLTMGLLGKAGHHFIAGPLGAKFTELVHGPYKVDVMAGLRRLTGHDAGPVIQRLSTTGAPGSDGSSGSVFPLGPAGDIRTSSAGDLPATTSGSGEAAHGGLDAATPRHTESTGAGLLDTHTISPQSVWTPDTAADGPHATATPSYDGAPRTSVTEPAARPAEAPVQPGTADRQLPDAPRRLRTESKQPGTSTEPPTTRPATDRQATPAERPSAPDRRVTVSTEDEEHRLLTDPAQPARADGLAPTPQRQTPTDPGDPAPAVPTGTHADQAQQSASVDIPHGAPAEPAMPYHYVDAPEHAHATAEEKQSWDRAQAELQDTYHEKLTDIGHSGAEEAEARRQVDTALEAWRERLPQGAPAGIADAVRERAMDLMRQQLRFDSSSRDEILANMPKVVETAAFHELALQVGMERFGRVIDNWGQSRLLPAHENHVPDLSPEAVERVRGHMADLFLDRAERELTHLHPNPTKPGTDHSEATVRAQQALDQFLSGLPADLNLRADYERVMDRAEELVTQLNTSSSWRDDLNDTDRALLEAVGAGPSLSDQGLRRLTGQLRDRLTEDLTATFGSLDSSREFGGDPDDALEQFNARLDQLAADLPHRFAEQLAGETVLSKVSDSAGQAADSWRETALPKLSPEAVEGLGLAGRDGSRYAGQLTRDLLKRAGQRLLRDDGRPEPDEWAAALTEFTDHNRLHDQITRIAAREAVGQSAEAEARTHLAAMPDGDRPELSTTSADRIGKGHADRVKEAFDQHFNGSDVFGDGLDERLRDYTAERRRLADELPARVSFEAEVMPRLNAAADAFDHLAHDNAADHEALTELKQHYGDDWFTAYHEHWAPREVDAERWLAHEADREGTFGAHLDSPAEDQLALVDPRGTGPAIKAADSVAHRTDPVSDDRAVEPSDGAVEPVHSATEKAAAAHKEATEQPLTKLITDQILHDLSAELGDDGALNELWEDASGIVHELDHFEMTPGLNVEHRYHVARVAQALHVVGEDTAREFAAGLGRARGVEPRLYPAGGARPTHQEEIPQYGESSSAAQRPVDLADFAFRLGDVDLAEIPFDIDIPVNPDELPYELDIDAAVDLAYSSSPHGSVDLDEYTFALNTATNRGDGFLSPHTSTSRYSSYGEGSEPDGISIRNDDSYDIDSILNRYSSDELEEIDSLLGPQFEPGPPDPESVLIELRSDKPVLVEPIPALSVSFGKERKTLEAPAVEQIRAWARTVAPQLRLLHDGGATTPEVDVVGYGNSLISANQTGAARAQAVRGALVQALRDELGGSWTSDAVENLVKPRSAGRAAPPPTDQSSQALGFPDRRRSVIATFRQMPEPDQLLPGIRQPKPIDLFAPPTGTDLTNVLSQPVVPREVTPMRRLSDYTMVSPHVGRLSDASPAERLAKGPSTFRGPAEFETVAASATDVAAFPAIRLIKPVEVLDHPDLRVSGDNTLALAAHDAGPVREFYAVPEAVADAQRKLALAGSNVKLVTDRDTYIEFEDGGQVHKLFKTTPDFTSKPTDVCRDFSEDTLGGGHSHIVLRDTRSPEQGGTGEAALAEISAANNAELSGVAHLAEGLAGVLDDAQQDNSQASVGWARVLMEKEKQYVDPERWPIPGEAYGKAQFRTTTSDAAKQRWDDLNARLGINEKAFAEVGEGYVIQSVPASKDGGIRSYERDFAHGTSETMPDEHQGVGYHFAPVVTTSMDGNHQVALQNFNMRKKRNAEMQVAVEGNLKFYGTHIEDIARQLEESKDRGEITPNDGRLRLAQSLQQIRQAREEIQRINSTPEPAPEDSARLGQLTGQEASGMANAVRAVAGLFGDSYGAGGDAWFFSLHGRGPEESFFDAWASLRRTGSDFSNPFAGVVKGDFRDQQIRLPIDSGAAPLSKTSRLRLYALADHAAKVALWRADQGLEPPTITITSRIHPEQKLRGLDAHADTVVSAFHTLLKARLNKRQEINPLRSGGTLGPQHFRAVHDVVLRDTEERNFEAEGADKDIDSIVSLQVSTNGNLHHDLNLRVDQLADLARRTGVATTSRAINRLKIKAFNKAKASVNEKTTQPGGTTGRTETTEPPNSLSRAKTATELRVTAAKIFTRDLTDTVTSGGLHVEPSDIAHMKHIVHLARDLTGRPGVPDVPTLTAVRKISETLRLQYGLSGPLKPEQLDPLVRDTLGLPTDAQITAEQRARLLELSRKPGWPGIGRPRQGGGAEASGSTAPAANSSDAVMPASAPSDASHAVVPPVSLDVPERFTNLPGEHEWAGMRESAPISHMDIERFDPRDNQGWVPGRPGPVPGRLPGWETAIRYDLRMMEPRPGHTVAEFTMRLDLQPAEGVSREHLEHFQDTLLDDIAHHVNGRYRLSEGEQFHLRVEFTDANPHHQVSVEHRPQGSDQVSHQKRWFTDESTGVLFHELFHSLGLREEYQTPGAVLRDGRRPATQPDDGGFMGTNPTADGMRGRYLATIDRLMRENLVLRTLPHDATLSPAGHSYDHGEPTEQDPAEAPLPSILRRLTTRTPNDPQGDAPATHTDPGMDAAIVDDWLRESAVPAARRSPALAQVDTAVRDWVNGGRQVRGDLDRNERELRSIQDTVNAWKATKGGESQRMAAVNRLSAHVQAQLDNVLQRRAEAERRVELGRRYTRIHPDVQRYAAKQAPQQIDPVTEPLHLALTEGRTPNHQLSENALSIADDITRQQLQERQNTADTGGISVQSGVSDEDIRALMGMQVNDLTGRTTYPEPASYLNRKDHSAHTDQGSSPTALTPQVTEVNGTRVTIHADPTDSLLDARIGNFHDALTRVQQAGHHVPDIEVHLPKYGRQLHMRMYNSLGGPHPTEPGTTHTAETHWAENADDAIMPASAQPTAQPVQEYPDAAVGTSGSGETDAVLGNQVRVPGDGRCLLYAALVSTPPTLWPRELRDNSPAAEWAAAHTQAVRQIQHQSTTGGGRLPQTPPLVAGAEALRHLVRDYLERTPRPDLPHDMVTAYHTNKQQAIAQRVAGHSRDDLLAQLRDNGIGSVSSPDWLYPPYLRELYVAARCDELHDSGLSRKDATAAARAEVRWKDGEAGEGGRWTLADSARSPREQFDYLQAQNGPISLDYLTDDGVRAAVVETMLQGPLTDQEFTALTNAVADWDPENQGWAADEGEMFPALLAEVMHVRFHIVQQVPGRGALLRAVVGPHDAPPVELYYDGGTHYDASDAHFTTPSAEPADSAVDAHPEPHPTQQPRPGTTTAPPSSDPTPHHDPHDSAEPPTVTTPAPDHISGTPDPAPSAPVVPLWVRAPVTSALGEAHQVDHLDEVCEVVRGLVPEDAHGAYRQALTVEGVKEIFPDLIDGGWTTTVGEGPEAVEVTIAMDLASPTVDPEELDAASVSVKPGAPLGAGVELSDTSHGRFDPTIQPIGFIAGLGTKAPLRSGPVNLTLKGLVNTASRRTTVSRTIRSETSAKVSGPGVRVTEDATWRITVRDNTAAIPRVRELAFPGSVIRDVPRQLLEDAGAEPSAVAPPHPDGPHQPVTVPDSHVPVRLSPGPLLPTVLEMLPPAFGVIGSSAYEKIRAFVSRANLQAASHQLFQTGLLLPLRLGGEDLVVKLTAQAVGPRTLTEVDQATIEHGSSTKRENKLATGTAHALDATVSAGLGMLLHQRPGQSGMGAAVSLSPNASVSGSMKDSHTASVTDGTTHDSSLSYRGPADLDAADVSYQLTVVRNGHAPRSRTVAVTDGLLTLLRVDDALEHGWRAPLSATVSDHRELPLGFAGLGRATSATGAAPIIARVAGLLPELVLPPDGRGRGRIVKQSADVFALRASNLATLHSSLSPAGMRELIDRGQLTIQLSATTPTWKEGNRDFVSVRITRSLVGGLRYEGSSEAVTMGGGVASATKIENTKSVTSGGNVDISIAAPIGLGTGGVLREVTPSAQRRLLGKSDEHSSAVSTKVEHGHRWTGADGTAAFRTGVKYAITVRLDDGTPLTATLGGEHARLALPSVLVPRAGTHVEPLLPSIVARHTITGNRPVLPERVTPIRELPGIYGVFHVSPALDALATEATELLHASATAPSAASAFKNWVAPPSAHQRGLEGQQLSEAFGSSAVGPNLGRILAGGYRLSLTRYWRLADRLGDLSLSGVLSNPRTIGAGTFTLKKTGTATNTGKETHSSANSWEWSAGLGLGFSRQPAGIFPGYSAKPRTGGASAAEAQELSAATTPSTTYTGPAVLVAFDASFVVGGTSDAHNVLLDLLPQSGQTTGHKQIDTHSSVVLIVPESEARGMGLIEPRAERTLSGAAQPDQPMPPPYLRYGLGATSVRHIDLPQIVTRVDELLAQLPEGWLLASTVDRVRDRLLKQFSALAAPEALGLLLPRVLGPGLPIYDEADGPFGRGQFEVILHGELVNPRYEGAPPDHTGQAAGGTVSKAPGEGSYSAQRDTTASTTRETTAKRNHGFEHGPSLKSSQATQDRTVTSVAEGADLRVSGKRSGETAHTAATEVTRSSRSDRDDPTYRYDLRLGITVLARRQAGRLPSYLTLGFTRLFDRTSELGSGVGDHPLPNAVRLSAPAADIAPADGPLSPPLFTLGADGPALDLPDDTHEVMLPVTDGVRDAVIRLFPETPNDLALHQEILAKLDPALLGAHVLNGMDGTYTFPLSTAASDLPSRLGSVRIRPRLTQPWLLGSAPADGSRQSKTSGTVTTKLSASTGVDANVFKNDITAVVAKTPDAEPGQSGSTSQWQFRTALPGSLTSWESSWSGDHSAGSSAKEKQEYDGDSHLVSVATEYEITRIWPGGHEQTVRVRVDGATVRLGEAGARGWNLLYTQPDPDQPAVLWVAEAETLHTTPDADQAAPPSDGTPTPEEAGGAVSDVHQPMRQV